MMCTYLANLKYSSNLYFFRFRGIMAVLNSSSANLGWLVGLILGRFCPLNLLIFTYSLPAAIFILISVFLPESPLWLTKHGQDDMAKKALEIVRGPKYPIQVREKKMKITIAIINQNFNYLHFTNLY